VEGINAVYPNGNVYSGKYPAESYFQTSYGRVGTTTGEYI
jgi:hypothetical protein